MFLQDVGISSNKHALIIPPFVDRGRWIHPMPNSDSSVPCNLFFFQFIGRSSYSFAVYDVFQAGFFLLKAELTLCFSATKSYGSKEKFSSLWIWNRGMEGTDGRVEEEAK